MATLIPPLEILAQSNVILSGPGEEWQGLAKQILVVIINPATDTTAGHYLIGPNGEGKLKCEVKETNGHDYVTTYVKPDFERGSLDVRLVRPTPFFTVLTSFGRASRFSSPEDFTFYHTAEGFGDFRGIYKHCTEHVIPMTLYNACVKELNPKE